jgi:alpha-glucosidase
MLGVLRFWLDRGVDGFRVDALRQVLKDPELRDNPPNPDYRPGSRRTTGCCRSTAPTTTTSRR